MRRPMIEGVREQSAAALAEGCAVLVLGGDCTTGSGSIAALLNTSRDPGVVYVDPHADMNVPASVTDGALDWMGLGHALGLPGALPEVARTCSLTSEQVVLCGYGEEHATEVERVHGPPDGSDTRRLADALAGACAAL
jgi:arginase